MQRQVGNDDSLFSGVERLFALTNGHTNADIPAGPRPDGPKETRHPLRQVRRGRRLLTCGLRSGDGPHSPRLWSARVQTLRGTYPSRLRHQLLAGAFLAADPWCAAAAATLPIVRYPRAALRVQGFNSALRGEGDPLNVLGGIPTVATDYSPIWDVNIGEWTPYAIRAGYRTRMFDEFQYLGEFVCGGAGVVLPAWRSG